jgi:ABC-type multidrug transport system fused ATPase/permease subunit
VAQLGQKENLSTKQVVWGILNTRERSQLLGILFLMLVGSVLETFSFGLIVPLIGMLTKPNYLEKFPAINNFLGDPSDEKFAVIAMGSMVLLYVFKSIFLIWSLWYQKGYSTAVTTRVGKQLFENYLRQPYVFHLNNNSATLIRNAQYSSSVMSGFIDPWLTIIADAFVTIGLVSVLLYLEPVGTIATIFIFGVSAFFFRQFTNRKIRRWGEAQKHYKGMLLKHLQQGFGGVKDVVIRGKEKVFVDKYHENLAGNATVLQRFVVAQALPRFGLEVLTILGLSVLITSMIIAGNGLASILPVLGLFGASAFRLLPAVSRSINNFQTINVSRPFIDDLYIDLLLSPVSIESHGPFRDFKFEGSINASNVSFRYESVIDQALINASIVINKGEAVGLVGTSGSGKSTLVDILLGLLKPDEGHVQIDGIDISSNLREWHNSVGYVPQSIFLIDDTLRANIAFGCYKNEIDEVAIREALKSAQLEDFVASLPEGLDTVVGERGVRLSGGQRQRIGIARALYHRPSVLVLDEATSSLDTETEHGVMQAVQALQGDKTVIIVAHRLSTVEYCDRLYRLDAGRIVDEGTFDEVMNRSKS